MSFSDNSDSMNYQFAFRELPEGLIPNPILNHFFIIFVQDAAVVVRRRRADAALRLRAGLAILLNYRLISRVSVDFVRFGSDM